MANLKKITVTIETDENTTVTVSIVSPLGGNPRFLNRQLHDSLEHLRTDLEEVIEAKFGKQKPSVAPSEVGRNVAQQVALWHIGDASWADILIDAYLNPAKAAADLKRDKES